MKVQLVKRNPDLDDPTPGALVGVILTEAEARFIATFIEAVGLSAEDHRQLTPGAETADLLARKIREVTNV